MRHLLTGLTILALLAPAALAQDGPVNLRPRFAPGKTTRYDFWSQRVENITTRFGSNERAMQVRYEFQGRVTWQVAQVRNDGSADCRMTFDWFVLQVTANDQTQTADSRKASAEWEAGHEFAKAIAGKTLTVRVAADGVIQRVDGVSAITSQISGDPENKPDEKDFQENAASLAVLWAAPAQASPGAAWNANFAWNHEMGTLNYRTTYTLNDVGELEGVPVAMVSSSSKLAMDFKDPKLPPDAPPLTMKFDGGEEHEQVVFDLSRGEAVARHMTQTLRATQTLRLEQGTLTQVREDSVTGQIVRVAEE